MANRCTRIPEIMMPREGTDLSKWAVIACDQYTSQPEYWAETDRIVGDAPSTLRLTLPEVYLEDADVASHIERIHKTMQQYVADGTLRTLPAGVVLTERWSGGSCPRRGIVLAVDLEAYEYTPGSASLIRPTEKTVVERIPPRLKVREGACLELPHIMILIDDPKRQIIEPLFAKTDSFSKLYDTDLMQNGGHRLVYPEGRGDRHHRGRSGGAVRPRDLQREVRLHGRAGAPPLRSRRRQPLHGYRQGILGGGQEGSDPRGAGKPSGSLCARGDRQHPRREHHHRADPPRTVRYRR